MVSYEDMTDLEAELDEVFKPGGRAHFPYWGSIYNKYYTARERAQGSQKKLLENFATYLQRLVEDILEEDDNPLQDILTAEEISAIKWPRLANSFSSYIESHFYRG